MYKRPGQTPKQAVNMSQVDRTSPRATTASAASDTSLLLDRTIPSGLDLIACHDSILLNTQSKLLNGVGSATAYLRHWGVISVVSCAIMIPSLVSAQWLRESGAAMAAAGIGDAIRSTAYGQAALTFNPAGMSQVPVYELQTGYSYSNIIEGHSVSAAIVDSATNDFVAAGVGYTFGHQQLVEGVSLQTHQLRGAMASGFRGETVSVFGGAGVRWVRRSPEEGNADDYITMDVGVLLVLSNLVRIGLVGQNLIPTDDKEANLPIVIGTGLAATYGGFLVAFDTAIDLDTRAEVAVQYDFGIQYTVLDMLPLRLGFQLDKIVEDKRMTAGLGYWSPVLAVDIGYQQSIDNTDSFLVGLDLRIMVP